MKGIVDRIEENFMVIEIEGKTTDVDSTKIAEDVKVGDVVVLAHGIWTTDKRETKQRKTKITKLMNEVWKD